MFRTGWLHKLAFVSLNPISSWWNLHWLSAIHDDDCHWLSAILDDDNHCLWNEQESSFKLGWMGVMHFTATNVPPCSHGTNRNSNYNVSLDNTDSVLQWTPIQYATKSQTWRSVTWLLENIVDRSGLDMITKGTRSSLHWPNHQWGCGIRSRVTSCVFIQYRCEHSYANL